MRTTAIAIGMVFAVTVALDGRADPLSAKGKSQSLLSKGLSGTWHGEKAGMKIKVAFQDNKHALLRVDYEGVGGISALVALVDDKKSGFVHLRVDTNAKPSGTVLGYLERGEGPGLKITILPVATEIDKEYRAVAGFPLSAVKERK